MATIKQIVRTEKEILLQVSTIAQPWVQLGNEITNLLDTNVFQEVRFVSAFVGLRAVLRLKDRIRYQTNNGASVSFTVGIDLGGTSKDVLEELIQWNANTYIAHNPIPRVTFHPKLYLFKTHNYAVLYIGSNNWTDGGLYTNHELATKYEFFLPQDEHDYRNIITPLLPFINPTGPVVAPLTFDLINVLSIRGMIVNEQEARRRRNFTITTPNANQNPPPNPFTPVAPVLPPILPTALRAIEQAISPSIPAQIPYNAIQANGIRPLGALVWLKQLSASEALQITNERTNPVGGIRLTQARFDPGSGRIDQTEYFRNLFSHYHWEHEQGRNRNTSQEIAIIPMRLFMLNRDYGVINFEVSHKPDGEANQHNYTTIIRWGRYLSPLIPNLQLTGRTLSLYETTDPDVRFYIDIS